MKAASEIYPLLHDDIEDVQEFSRSVCIISLNEYDTPPAFVELIFNVALICKRSPVRWFLLEKEGYFPTHFDYPLVLFQEVCVN